MTTPTPFLPSSPAPVRVYGVSPWRPDADGDYTHYLVTDAAERRYVLCVGAVIAGADGCYALRRDLRLVNAELAP